MRLILTLVLAAGMLGCGPMPAGINSVKGWVAVDTKSGLVLTSVCSSYQTYTCGISMWRCQQGETYSCLNNVQLKAIR